MQNWQCCAKTVKLWNGYIPPNFGGQLGAFEKFWKGTDSAGVKGVHYHLSRSCRTLYARLCKIYTLLLRMRVVFTNTRVPGALTCRGFGVVLVSADKVRTPSLPRLLLRPNRLAPAHLLVACVYIHCCRPCIDIPSS